MDIDFVITWVDGDDPKWINEKQKYNGENGDNRAGRYRNWDNLQYIFRGIEKYADWVHKVYLVTCGHYPEWLNMDHPKLEVIKHEDYIPSEWLPTFSSQCIDTNFHRIKPLSEHFVYFDDDMFILDTVKPETFFKKGLPCGSAVMRVWPYMSVRPGKTQWLAPLYDTILINRHFDKKKSIGKHFFKWFSPCYGKEALHNLYLLPFKEFTGFRGTHLPVSYLKSTYDEVWSKEEKMLAETCSHRFRHPNDLSHWVFSYWQLASGSFYPRSLKIGKKYQISADTIENAVEDIKNQRYRLMCLNDSCEDEDFESLKDRVNLALNDILPERSTFERPLI